MVAQHRELSFQLGFFPVLQCRSKIGADCEDLHIHSIEFSDTSLVRQHFLRSTTGERSGEERQNNRILSLQIGQSYLTARCR